jgi:hypothetical protein
MAEGESRRWAPEQVIVEARRISNKVLAVSVRTLLNLPNG